MRTTLTLDADVAALIRRVMKEKGLTLKEAVNSAIRAGLDPAREQAPFETRSFRMGFNPAIPWDKALGIAAGLEDDELIRKLDARK